MRALPSSAVATSAVLWLSTALYHPRAAASDTLKLAFDLKNAGPRDGDEVVQVYFRHVKSAVPQPRLALCGFARVNLPPGKTARVTVAIPVERFRYWDTAKKCYAVEAGDYELLVGGASDQLPLHLAMRVTTK